MKTKTIFIREKKSGDFEFTNEKNATHVFLMDVDFKQWFESLRIGKLIKMEQKLAYEHIHEMDNALCLKREADEIYYDFINNVKLPLLKFRDGKFILFSNFHSYGHLKIVGGEFVILYKNMDKEYIIELSKKGIFEAIQTDYSLAEMLRREAQRAY